MNQQTKYGEVAARIRAAYAGTPIAPIRPQLTDLDVDAAYAIQQENTAYWETEGRRLVGSKIGLTSRAVQKQLGVDRPDFGVLFADMIVAEDEPVAVGRVLQPKIESFETLATSATRHEGVLRLCSHISGEVQEHAYWGSARDRIPSAQTDPLAPSGKVEFEVSGPVTARRIRVRSHGNVCVIRSGQDWSDSAGRERELYLQKMEPVLRRGMDFLRDGDPAVTGCYSCRYADVLDASARPLDKRFGLAWFRSLHDLERWSESHPTHLAIFNTFMEMVQELNGQLTTQFYHEVSVLAASEQRLEYLNCHPSTGLLRLQTERG